MPKTGLMLTLAELEDLHMAVELRAESCEGNCEVKEARRWRRLLRKIEAVMPERV